MNDQIWYFSGEEKPPSFKKKRKEKRVEIVIINDVGKIFLFAGRNFIIPRGGDIYFHLFFGYSIDS